jgi:hypothetical protein
VIASKTMYCCEPANVVLVESLIYEVLSRFLLLQNTSVVAQSIGVRGGEGTKKERAEKQLLNDKQLNGTDMLIMALLAG